MPRLRNERHELFTRNYIRAEFNGAEAYRRTYNAEATGGTARRVAYKILQKPKVKARLQELMRPMLKKADVTIDACLNEYEEAREIAKKQGKSAEMQSATERKAKLVGLLRDRVEAGNVGDFDKTDSVADILEIVEREVGAEAALALAKAFKVPESAPVEEPTEEEKILFEAESPSEAVN